MSNKLLLRRLPRPLQMIVLRREAHGFTPTRAMSVCHSRVPTLLPFYQGHLPNRVHTYFVRERVPTITYFLQEGYGHRYIYQFRPILFGYTGVRTQARRVRPSNYQRVFQRRVRLLSGGGRPPDVVYQCLSGGLLWSYGVHFYFSLYRQFFFSVHAVSPMVFQGNSLFFRGHGRVSLSIRVVQGWPSHVSCLHYQVFYPYHCAIYRSQVFFRQRGVGLQVLFRGATSHSLIFLQYGNANEMGRASSQPGRKNHAYGGFLLPHHASLGVLEAPLLAYLFVFTGRSFPKAQNVCRSPIGVFHGRSPGYLQALIYRRRVFCARPFRVLKGGLYPHQVGLVTSGRPFSLRHYHGLYAFTPQYHAWVRGFFTQLHVRVYDQHRNTQLLGVMRTHLIVQVFSQLVFLFMVGPIHFP